MKEYKVVTFIQKTTFSRSKADKELTDFLNEYARAGWSVVNVHNNMMHFVFERDKNR